MWNCKFCLGSVFEVENRGSQLKSCHRLTIIFFKFLFAGIDALIVRLLIWYDILFNKIQ